MDNQYEALIFDLDDTLLDTTKELLPAAIQSACEKMIMAGLNCDLKTCIQEWTKSKARKNIFEHLVNVFGPQTLKTQIMSAGEEVFYNMPLPESLAMVPGAQKLLERAFNKYPLFLVTYGKPSAQQSKIKILKIENFFKEILFVPLKQKKQDSFLKIQKKYDYIPEKILCIGNRLSHEIQEGKALGFKTCWFKYGEHSDEVVENLSSITDFCIESFEEIYQKCQL